MKALLSKYKIEKVGLHNGTQKMCLCGKVMDISEKECPDCGEKLPKSSLLNVAKNTALAKRFEENIDGNIITLKYYHLLSNAFELYETSMLEITINKDTCEVTISDPKMFKSLANKQEMNDLFTKNLPGFTEYVKRCLGLFRYEYAVTNLYSLSPGQISNFLNIYLNYKALDKYLLGYKVFYYGNRVNLKKYFPATDFNNIEEVKKINLCLDLLLTWDIKNEKYIETIIDISNTASKEQLESLVNIIKEMTAEANRGYRSNIEYNDIVETFGLLYNKDISLENFLRIKNNSHDNYFCQFNAFKQNYKKCISKNINWDEIDGLDRKTIGSLAVKAELLKGKVLDKKDLVSVYETLEKDPLEALKEMASKCKKK